MQRYPGPEMRTQDLRDIYKAVHEKNRQLVVSPRGLCAWLEQQFDVQIPSLPTAVYQTGFRWAARWDFIGGSVEVWVGYNQDRWKVKHPFADVRVTFVHQPVGWDGQQRWFETTLADQQVSR